MEHVAGANSHVGKLSSVVFYLGCAVFLTLGCACIHWCCDHMLLCSVLGEIRKKES